MVYLLDDNIIFPDTSEADEDGLLAIGGDLSPERIIEAYKSGIFPWYSEGNPILWWSPNPRFVLFPEKLIKSSSMAKLLRKNKFQITFNNCFSHVMTLCGKTREEEGTWINNDMIDSYTQLHELGYAHSIEAWEEGILVGGLYGLAMGKCFFGESMFSLVPNSSKAAFITLTEHLRELGFVFIDCQVYSKHLESLGAEMIDRNQYLDMLKKWLYL